MGFLDELIVGVVTVVDGMFNDGKLTKSAKEELHGTKEEKGLLREIQEEKRYMYGKTDEELKRIVTSGTLVQRHAAAEVYKSRHRNQK